MFDDLDDPGYAGPGSAARDAVAARAGRLRRNRRIAWTSGVATFLVVVVALGAGLRSRPSGLAGVEPLAPAPLPTTATPSPSVTPAESPTPTPSPTPTETPVVDVTVKPERPAALDEPPSVEGAVAVAEYFLLLFPYVNATGDLSDWSALSHADCIYCTNVAARVNEKFGLG